MHSGKRPFAFLLSFTALLAAGVALCDPLTLPMPGYMDNIREWAAHGYVADTFTPLAYPLLGGLGYRAGGVPGLMTLQALLHVTIAATAYAILRRLQLPPRWAGFGAVPLVLHPDLLTSVAKIWDVSLSTELYLLIALALLHLLPVPGELPGTSSDGPPRAWLRTASAGIALGAGMSSRPNFMLLVPLLLWAACRRDARQPMGRTVAATVVFVSAALAFAALGGAEHGRAFFPGNGPYNLYAGHNAFTAQALRQQENAEPSIVPAYSAALDSNPALPHLSEHSGDYYAARLRPFYTSSAAEYALHHPGGEVELAALKLFTLFRPDTKVHPIASPAGLAKAVLALPVLLLVAALLWRPKPRLDAVDRALLLLDALYIVPFLLTNADPRFRTPLDALMLLQVVRLLWLRLGKPTAPALSA